MTNRKSPGCESKIGEASKKISTSVQRVSPGRRSGGLYLERSQEPEHQRSHCPRLRRRDFAPFECEALGIVRVYRKHHPCSRLDRRSIQSRTEQTDTIFRTACGETQRAPCKVGLAVFVLQIFRRQEYSQPSLRYRRVPGAYSGEARGEEHEFVEAAFNDC